jgi:hypothetical protein
MDTQNSKVVCECGLTIIKRDKSRHNKSQRHIRLMSGVDKKSITVEDHDGFYLLKYKVNNKLEFTKKVRYGGRITKEAALLKMNDIERLVRAQYL